MLSQDQTVERAFQLARKGTCRSVDEVRRILKAEGFISVDAHLAGTMIKKQLSTLIKAHAPLRPASGEFGATSP